LFVSHQWIRSGTTQQKQSKPYHTLIFNTFATLVSSSKVSQLLVPSTEFSINSSSSSSSSSSNMNEEETNENTDLKGGPFSVLYKAVRGNLQVLVNVRNNHKLLGRVKAYDRHMNL